jgi:hypothetical protein
MYLVYNSSTTNSKLRAAVRRYSIIKAEIVLMWCILNATYIALSFAVVVVRFSVALALTFTSVVSRFIFPVLQGSGF